MIRAIRPFSLAFRHFITYPMFQFKQFTIRQDRTPMKVGTDGVLLGAWAELEYAENILDIGTGTGLIALMSAQRNSSARINAIEIEPDACQQARENVSASRWADRIEVIQSALQDFKPEKAYDSIVCNPPFFINSTLTPDNGRTLARHCDSLPHTDLIIHVVRLLAPGGTFSVILPVCEAKELITYAQLHQLYPHHITRVHPTPTKPPKRYLIQFSTDQSNTIEDDLVIELSRHQYSKEYIELTRDFYLLM